MSHIEFSDYEVKDEINNTIPIPNMEFMGNLQNIDIIDIALVFAIVVFFTKFIKSLKT